ncbi:MAG: sugar phosphate isomerase/epimerase [Clostridia bacterium]|nr:sugar phosphate isomerase/epimerase [Clostridia bacterium]
MQVGISTASLFKRQYNEDALITLNELDAKVVEIFLGSYCEYTKDFASLLKERKGNLQVHSIHTLNTHFEPQLFADNPRAIEDAYKILENCLHTANTLGAKNYTLHGIARFKKDILYNNYEVIGKKFEKLNDFCLSKGVNLCLENVEWAYYNRVGFLTEISKYCKGLKTCLDVKQARVSGDSYKDYINEMQNTIQTVHVSDVDDFGKICIPGKGVFDFDDLFMRLSDVGFNGAMLIEVYSNNYGEIGELKDGLNFLRDKAEKYF